MKVEYIYYHQDVRGEYDPEPRAGTQEGHNPPKRLGPSAEVLQVGDVVEIESGWFVKVRHRCVMLDGTLRLMVVDQGARWMVTR